MANQLRVVLRISSSPEEGTEWKYDDKTISPQWDPLSPKYSFDHIFAPKAKDETMYGFLVQPITDEIMQGKNGSIIVYGHRTHPTAGTVGEQRIIPFSIAKIFTSISNTPNREYLLRVSHFAISGDTITDLLSSVPTHLEISENECGVTIHGIHEEIITSTDQVLYLLQKSQEKFHTVTSASGTATIFKMVVESKKKTNKTNKTSKTNKTENKENFGMKRKGRSSLSRSKVSAVRVSFLNFVDLVYPQHKEQNGCDNSLVAVRKVVDLLASKSRGIPYANNKLTRILRPDLGGNCKTAIICTMKTAITNREESLDALQFAQLAKQIKNLPLTTNKLRDDKARLNTHKKQIAEMKRELTKLENESSALEELGLLMNEQQDDQKNKQLRDNILSKIQKAKSLILKSTTLKSTTKQSNRSSLNTKSLSPLKISDLDDVDICPEFKEDLPSIDFTSSDHEFDLSSPIKSFIPYGEKKVIPFLTDDRPRKKLRKSASPLVSPGNPDLPSPIKLLNGEFLFSSPPEESGMGSPDFISPLKSSEVDIHGEGERVESPLMEDMARIDSGKLILEQNGTQSDTFENKQLKKKFEELTNSNFKLHETICLLQQQLEESREREIIHQSEKDIFEKNRNNFSDEKKKFQKEYEMLISEKKKIETSLDAEINQRKLIQSDLELKIEDAALYKRLCQEIETTTADVKLDFQQEALRMKRDNDRLKLELYEKSREVDSLKSLQESAGISRAAMESQERMQSLDQKEAVDTLSARLEALTSELDAARHRCTTLEKDYRSLTIEKEILEKRETELSEVCQRLKIEIQNSSTLSVDLGRLREREVDLVAKLEAVGEELDLCRRDRARERSESLEREETARQESSRLHETVSFLTSQVETLSAKNAAAAAADVERQRYQQEELRATDLVELEEELYHARRREATYKEELATLRATMVELECRAGSLEERLSAVQGEYADFQASAVRREVAYETSVSALRTQTERLTEELDRSEKECMEERAIASRQVEEHNVRVFEFMTQVTTLDQTVSEFHTQLTCLEKERAEEAERVERIHQEERRKDMEERMRLEGEKIQLEERIRLEEERIRRERTRLEEEMASLLLRQGEFEEECQRLRELLRTREIDTSLVSLQEELRKEQQLRQAIEAQKKSLEEDSKTTASRLSETLQERGILLETLRGKLEEAVAAEDRSRILCGDLERRLREVETDRDRLGADVMQLVTVRDHLKQKLEEAEHSYHVLQTKYNQVQMERQDLYVQVDRLQTDVTSHSQINTDLADLRSQLRSSEEKLATVTEEKSQALSLYASSSAHCVELDQALAKKTAEYLHLLQVKDNLENLAQTWQAHSAHFASEMNFRNTLLEERTQLVTENENLLHEKERAERTVDGLRKRVEELEAELAETEKEALEAIGKVEMLERNVSEMHSSLEKNEETVAQLSDTKEELLVNVSALNTEIQEWKKKLSDNQFALFNLTLSKQELELTNEKLTQTVEDLRRKISETENFSQEKARLTDLLEEARANLVRAEERVVQLAKTQEELTKTLEATTSELNYSKHDVLHTNQLFHVLEKQLLSTRSENSDLKKSKAHIESIIQQHQAEAATMKKENAELKAGGDAGVVLKLRQENEGLKKDIFLLKAHEEELTAANTHLQEIASKVVTPQFPPNTDQNTSALLVQISQLKRQVKTANEMALRYRGQRNHVLTVAEKLKKENIQLLDLTDENTDFDYNNSKPPPSAVPSVGVTSTTNQPSTSVPASNRVAVPATVVPNANNRTAAPAFVVPNNVLMNSSRSNVQNVAHPPVMASCTTNKPVYLGPATNRTINNNI